MMNNNNDHLKLYNMLLDPSDPRQNSAFGRVRHLAICLFMSSALTLVLVVGGWISAVIFKMLLIAAVSAFVEVVGAKAEIGPLIWVPFAIGVGLVWLVLVAGPAVWAILNILAMVMGLLSALRPDLSRSPEFVRVANWLLATARRAGLPFARS